MAVPQVVKRPCGSCSSKHRIDPCSKSACSGYHRGLECFLMEQPLAPRQPCKLNSVMNLYVTEYSLIREEKDCEISRQLFFIFCYVMLNNRNKLTRSLVLSGLRGRCTCHPGWTASYRGPAAASRGPYIEQGAEGRR